MRHPHGTTVVDVADPAHPRVVAEIEIPKGWHSHKVRVADGLMVINHEHQGGNGEAEFQVGLAIYDVADPARPVAGRRRRLSRRPGGRAATLPPSAAFERPALSELLTPRLSYPRYRRYGKPPPGVVGKQWRPTGPHPTHTCLPFRDALDGRKIMVVAEEDVAKQFPASPAGVTVFDITDETAPQAIAEFQVEELAGDDAPAPAMTGCHQPSDRWHGPVVSFAWFAQGLRLVDFRDPLMPRETTRFLPDPPAGEPRICSNDVTMDDRGLLYLIDRNRGVDIIEVSVF